MKCTDDTDWVLMAVEEGNRRCVEALNTWRRHAWTWRARRAIRWMELIALLIGFVSFLTSAATAASVTLAWDANPETNIVSYKIYYGRTSGNYLNVLSVGNVTSYTVTNLLASTRYFFVATAVNAQGQESDFSAEVSNTTPTPVTPPRNFRFLTNSLQGAVGTNGPWQQVAVFTLQIPTSNGLAFYRNRLNWEQ